MNIKFNAFKPKVDWAKSIGNKEYPVDKAVKEKINEIKPELIAAAKECKANITLAQKGDLLMVNSGAVTSAINQIKTTSSKDLYSKIVNNIYANRDAAKGEALTRILTERNI